MHASECNEYPTYTRLDTLWRGVCLPTKKAGGCGGAAVSELLETFSIQKPSSRGTWAEIDKIRIIHDYFSKISIKFSKQC